MILASFIVFMLFHAIAVRGEMYPISVFKDVAQVDDNPDNFVEPPEYKGFLASYQGDPADKNEIDWMKDNIVDRYGFQKDPKMDAWIKQPNFKDDLGTDEFVTTANRVKSFFDKHSDWDTTKNLGPFRTENSCLKLLYITAARYLLVTHVLYTESDRKVVPCDRDDDNFIENPDSVCYPTPYGGATCTSDYDVGLIGKDAGYVIEKFNNYFQSSKGFGKPSEIVFDTNVYAFTLEYAMPDLFAGLPTDFSSGVEQKENTIYYRMQELASAYYKVFKYNDKFFQTMKVGAESAIKDAETESKDKLKLWLNTFKKMNAEAPMKLGGLSQQTFRTDHNREYGKYVKGMSEKGGYNPAFLDDLAKALIYAAEAYHTRGAIRHVVGVTQMKVKVKLSTEDLWVSMIENWGDTNKEYHHCEGKPVEECLLKSSKYMWRMFDAMKRIWERLPPNETVGLVQFDAKDFSNPEYAADKWLEHRKKGEREIPKDTEDVRKFFDQFGCDPPQFGKPFSSACISKMNDKVNAYNLVLAGLVKDDSVLPGGSGRVKGFAELCIFVALFNFCVHYWH
ncbi:uncharacterized protein [Montipora foliosa]|uniref:uncharacterized protein n=1 Tax=Montipora foliosa TaxID=591990 RepID=UPI0035F1C000